MSDEKFQRLPGRVDPATTVEEVPHQEAVGEVHGVRRVSPFSPVAGIDEARVHAAIATDRTAQPWRRRTARLIAIYLLCSIVAGLAFSLYARARWR